MKWFLTPFPRSSIEEPKMRKDPESVKIGYMVYPFFWVLLAIAIIGMLWNWWKLPPSDVIHFTNGGTDIKAVLVDGTVPTGATFTFMNDFTVSPTTLSSLLIGDFNNKVTADLGYTNNSASHDPLLHPGAAIVFADNRPPLTVVDVDWKDDSTTIDVTLPDSIEVPIKIWIVNSGSSIGLTYSDIRTQAMAAVARANQIYQQERQGITLRPDLVTPNYVDKTLVGSQERTDFGQFDCSLADPKNLNSSQKITTIGYEPRMLNVYYVATVGDNGSLPFSSFSGFWCGGVDAYDVIAIGIEASDDLLVHEVGHAFSLDHVGDLPSGFNQENVMEESPTCISAPVNGRVRWVCGRAYLTEGQTYRQVTNKTQVDINGTVLKIGSVLYDPTIYHLSLPFTRHCGHWLRTDLRVGAVGWVFQPEKSLCPPIEKRIWADGSLLPN